MSSVGSAPRLSKGVPHLNKLKPFLSETMSQKGQPMKFTIRTLCAAMAMTAASSAAYADNLEQIYQQALTNDPIVLQAQAQRDAMYAKVDESRSPLLPSITANVGYGKSWHDINNDRNGNFNTGAFQGGVTLNQVIYNHGAWVGLNVAELAASQSDAAYASTLQDLIVRVTQAYFNVLAAKDAYEFQGAEVRAIERQLEQTKQRFAVGLTAITDVHEAQAQYDLARAQQIQAKNTLANSYESLQEITGVHYTEVNDLDTQRFSPQAPMPVTVNDWITISEENNIGITIQKIAKNIASEQISLAKSGHLPSLNLTAGYNGQFDSTASSNTPQGSVNDNGTGSIGINLSIPIFEGLGTSSKVNQAQYLFVEANAKLDQTHRAVEKNIRNGFNNVNASISSIKAYEQTVISAESALKATQASFEVGTRTIVDVLNSTRDLYNAKRQLSDARYGYINSILALKQAAGTLSEQDIKTINAGLTITTNAKS